MSKAAVRMLVELDRFGGINYEPRPRGGRLLVRTLNLGVSGDH